MRLGLLSLTILALAVMSVSAAGAANPGGKMLRVNGWDTAEATTLESAIPVNATGPLRVQFAALAWPGPDATATHVRVQLVLSPDFEMDLRSANTTATFRQGQAHTFSMEVPLQGVATLGSGAFRLHVELLDAAGNALFSDVFLVKLANPSIVTVQGVMTSGLSLVLAYGLWRLMKDILTLLGFLAERKAPDDPTPAPRPTGFLQAMRDTPSALRVAALALGVACIATMWGHVLGLVPLGEETVVDLLDKAQDGLLLAGVGYAALVGVQVRRLRRAAADTSDDATAPAPPSETPP